MRSPGLSSVRKPSIHAFPPLMRSSCSRLPSPICLASLGNSSGTHGISATVSRQLSAGLAISTSLTKEYSRNESPRKGASHGCIAYSSEPVEVLAFLEKVVEECGYSGKIAYAVDCATSDKGIYKAATATYPWIDEEVSVGTLRERLMRLTERFPMQSSSP